MKVRSLEALSFNSISFMQGTKAEGAIAKLFVGKMKSYIKCVNVDYESSRSEEFNGELRFMTQDHALIVSQISNST